MKVVMSLLAGLLMVSGAHAQSTLDSVAIHEGGGSIGNGGEIREIDLLTIIKKIKAFLLTEKGAQYFASVDESYLAKIVSETKIQVLNEDLHDSKGHLRSARNIRMGDQSLIQFSAKSLAEIGSDEASLYVLVFHEYLNLMGIELSQDASVSSVYPVSSKLIPFVGEIEKIQVDPTAPDFSYHLDCKGSLHAVVLKKNLFGKWVAKGESTISSMDNLGLVRMPLRLREDAAATYSVDDDQVVVSGQKIGSNHFSLQASKIENDSVQVKFEINGQSLAAQTVPVSKDSVWHDLSFAVQPAVDYADFVGPNEKEKVDRVDLSCLMSVQYR